MHFNRGGTQLGENSSESYRKKSQGTRTLPRDALVSVKLARDSLLVKDNPDVMVCVLQHFPWHLVFRMRYTTHFPSYALPPVWPDVLRKLSSLRILINNYHLLLNLGAESSAGDIYFTHHSCLGFVQLAAESNRKSRKVESSRNGRDSPGSTHGTVKRHWLVQLQG